MSFRTIASLVVLMLFAAVAFADGPTKVTGRVTDVLGRPVKEARVYVLPRAGEPIVSETDGNGVYSVDVEGSGTHGVVIAIDKAHTFRQVIVQVGMVNKLDIEVELDTEGGEVIKIEDKKRPAPKVEAKPTTDPRQSLPYSEEAVERDAWARAWFLLDVDEQGVVQRLKLLKRPGFDLDAIAIEEAFKLRFEPARDDAGRPMKTYVLWSMEWPSFGWLVQGNGTTSRRPADDQELHVHGQNIRGAGLARANWARPSAAATVYEGSLSRVPCAGSGPLNLDLRNRAYRDCSKADLSKSAALPWITRETAATAIAELARPDLMLDEKVVHHSRVPALISTGVTGVVLGAWLFSYLRFEKYSQKVRDASWQLTIDPEAYRKHEQQRDKWAKISIGMTAAAVISTGVTLFMWNKNQSKRSFSVQPAESGDGASASIGGSF